VNIRKLANGNLLVPSRAEGDGIVGDGVVEIGPDHPDSEGWWTYVSLQKAMSQHRPKSRAAPSLPIESGSSVQPIKAAAGRDT
jgi:hypothetical protein